MKIRVIAVGSRPRPWVVDGFREYARRLPREMPLSLVEVVPGGGRGRSAEQAMATESERLLNHLGPRDWVIALDVGGEGCSTRELALRLEEWRMQGQDVAFLIGGAEGLAPACLARADMTLSLSRLTFPHEMVRVMVAEQIYRAWTILSGHPYHRD
ncbi:MAG: 23S rRNA (pseudouridine(1915)-N(3))-methyltransferase RlmH [Pseudomonadales bacterium]|nr:23S rRNA (pseudouridine(1915)-N(3))-methyltransferase RlmH [Pseudomonadales bacterium]NIX09522.1 23S rRNA (pseudouridine(1915)-N(3))-methyltransferase RlmH [Pseudomonadales bacterium]